MFDDKDTRIIDNNFDFPARQGAYCRGCGRILDSVWCHILPVGTIVDKCDICLHEGLPKEAIYIESKDGMDRLAYHQYEKDMVAIWSRAPQGVWFEWWDMDLECFEAEFGVKL